METENVRIMFAEFAGQVRGHEEPATSQTCKAGVNEIKAAAGIGSAEFIHRARIAMTGAPSERELDKLPRIVEDWAPSGLGAPSVHDRVESSGGV